MKRVLLLGDSIREHCQVEVQKQLGSDYVVYFPWENGRFSAYTLNSLRFWFDYIPAEEIDIIHWNNGLWDTGRWDGEEGCFCDLETYLDNMDRILRVLRKKTNAKIILATSTPIRMESEGKNPRRLSDIQRYNEALIEKFTGKVDAINDLYSFVFPERQKMICEDYVHPNEYGKKKIAGEMCKYIRQMT